MATVSLSARDVSVDFSGLRALDGVTLEINTGEIIGLIGPNGSGKTTLVNVMTGQVKPVSGSVTCNQIDITRRTPREIALIGVARSFQIVRLFRNLTVAENVETATLTNGHSRRSARRKVARLLEDFDLLRFADQQAGTLNYGDERRVEIARALAADPKFLLLDEPAAGMNENEGGKLLQTLAELPSQRGLGILIIDHHMPFIMRLCHRLHVLSSGKTIGEGEVEDVRTMPAVMEAYLGSTATREKHDAQG